MGVLSSLAGMQSFYKAAEAAKGTSSLAKKTYKFKKKANYMFGKEANLLNKSLTYGTQNVATNFAYMDRKYFTKNYGLNQIGAFVSGFVNGASQFVITNRGIDDSFGIRFGASLFSYYIDYAINTISTTDYSPSKYYDKKKKQRIFSLKAFGFTF